MVASSPHSGFFLAAWILCLLIGSFLDCDKYRAEAHQFTRGFELHSVWPPALLFTIPAPTAVTHRENWSWLGVSVTKKQPCSCGSRQCGRSKDRRSFVMTSERGALEPLRGECGRWRGPYASPGTITNGGRPQSPRYMIGQRPTRSTQTEVLKRGNLPPYVRRKPTPQREDSQALQPWEEVKSTQGYLIHRESDMLFLLDSFAHYSTLGKLATLNLSG